MMTDNDEWLTSREGAELLGTGQSNFLYYAKKGDIAIKPGSKEKERLYNRADIIKVRKRLTRKARPAPPAPPLIDWSYTSDVPAGLRFIQTLYREDVDLAELAVYQSWRKNNNHISMAAFSQDRQTCFAAIQILPLPESAILDILSEKRTENSIQPDEVRSFEDPGPYDLLVTSAAVLPDRRILLYEVLKAYMAFWRDEMYPKRYIRRIYAQVVSPEGMRLVQHFHMAPRPDLSFNAFMIDLAWPPVFKLIRDFKQQLEAKAPLPPDLQWPPVPVQPPVSTTPPPAKKRPESAVRVQEVASTPPDLPEGSLTLADFAAQLGINRTTLLGQVRDYSLQHIAIPKPNRPNESDRFFTPEQQQAYRDWRATRPRR